MKLLLNENVIELGSKKFDLDEVLTRLASKDPAQVAELFSKVSGPRALRMNAIKVVTNEFVKSAKDLNLSDEMMYRLNWYPNFTEFQLVNFWGLLERDNAKVFDAGKALLTFKKSFFKSLLLNAKLVGLDDKLVNQALDLADKDVTLEEYLTATEPLFYDFEKELDGLCTCEFKTTLRKSATVAQIRAIADKYGINVPKRLRKEELVAIVMDGLKAQKKVEADTETKLNKMSAILLQRFAKQNGINVSTEMKKPDAIEFILGKVDTVEHKPVCKYESLPELAGFEFSKDFLREVAYKDEEEDVEEAPVIEETPVVVEEHKEEVEAPVIEEKPQEEVKEEKNVASIDETVEAVLKALDERKKNEEVANLDNSQLKAYTQFYENHIAFLEKLILTMQERPINIGFRQETAAQVCEPIPVPEDTKPVFPTVEDESQVEELPFVPDPVDETAPVVNEEVEEVSEAPKAKNKKKKKMGWFWFLLFLALLALAIAYFGFRGGVLAGYINPKENWFFEFVNTITSIVPADGAFAEWLKGAYSGVRSFFVDFLPALFK